MKPHSTAGSSAFTTLGEIEQHAEGQPAAAVLDRRLAGMDVPDRIADLLRRQLARIGVEEAAQ